MYFIINLALRAFAILGMNWLGWLVLMDGHRKPVNGFTKESITAALIAALIFSLIAALLMIFTGCLAALLTGFFGGAVLGLMQHFAGGYIDTPGFWYTVLCGFILILIESPRITYSYSSSN